MLAEPSGRPDPPAVAGRWPPRREHFHAALTRLRAALSRLRGLWEATLRATGRAMRWRGSSVKGELAAMVGMPTMLPTSSLLSLCNFVVVDNTATSSSPSAAEEVLLYFNYQLSPFYAQLPPNASKEVEPRPAGSPSPPPVQWMRHRLSKPVSELDAASDASRLRLLRELYADAQAEERSLPPQRAWRRHGGAKMVALPASREVLSCKVRGFYPFPGGPRRHGAERV